MNWGKMRGQMWNVGLFKKKHLTCAYYEEILKVQFLLVDHGTEWCLLHFHFFQPWPCW